MSNLRKLIIFNSDNKLIIYKMHCFSNFVIPNAFLS